jgi:hypothetical protein
MNAIYTAFNWFKSDSYRSFKKDVNELRGLIEVIPTHTKAAASLNRRIQILCNRTNKSDYLHLKELDKNLETDITAIKDRFLICRKDGAFERRFGTSSTEQALTSFKDSVYSVKEPTKSELLQTILKNPKRFDKEQRITIAREVAIKDPAAISLPFLQILPPETILELEAIILNRRGGGGEEFQVKFHASLFAAAKEVANYDPERLLKLDSKVPDRVRANLTMAPISAQTFNGKYDQAVDRRLNGELKKLGVSEQDYASVMLDLPSSQEQPITIEAFIKENAKSAKRLIANYKLEANRKYPDVKADVSEANIKYSYVKADDSAVILNSFVHAGELGMCYGMCLAKIIDPQSQPKALFTLAGWIQKDAARSFDKAGHFFDPGALESQGLKFTFSSTSIPISHLSRELSHKAKDISSSSDGAVLILYEPSGRIRSHAIHISADLLSFSDPSCCDPNTLVPITQTFSTIGSMQIALSSHIQNAYPNYTVCAILGFKKT